MWPVKSAMKSSYMWPVIKSSHMQSVKPATTQSNYKKFSQVSMYDDKNCQSTLFDVDFSFYQLNLVVSW